MSTYWCFLYIVNLLGKSQKKKKEKKEKKIKREYTVEVDTMILFKNIMILKGRVREIIRHY